SLIDALTSWFLPGRLPLAARAAVLAGLIGALVAASLTGRATDRPASLRRLYVPVVLGASYVAMLTAIACLYPLSQEMRRLAAPAYVWTVMILLDLVVAAVRAVRGRSG